MYIVMSNKTDIVVVSKASVRYHIRLGFKKEAVFDSIETAESFAKRTQDN